MKKGGFAVVMMKSDNNFELVRHISMVVEGIWLVMWLTLVSLKGGFKAQTHRCGVGMT